MSEHPSFYDDSFYGLRDDQRAGKTLFLRVSITVFLGEINV